MKNTHGCCCCCKPLFIGAVLLLVWLLLGPASSASAAAPTTPTRTSHGKAAFVIATATNARKTPTSSPNKEITIRTLLPSFRLSMTNNSNSNNNSSNNNGDDDDNKDHNKKDDDNGVAFLDRLFFDPSKVKDGSPFQWFATMVEQDYETAEALYASSIIAILVLISQELIRFQVLGEHYVPFKAGGGSGSGMNNGIW